MTDAPDDPALEQRSRDLFNEQVAHLDGRTRSRLNQARQAALAAARGHGHSVGQSVHMSRSWLVPTGSVAALALVAVVSWQVLRPDSEVNVAEPNTAIAGTVDDLEIITASEDLDLLQNMDFYAWLDNQTDDAELSGEDG